MINKILLACALAYPIGMFSALPAQASCGAAFCTLNTHWESQGVWTEPGLRVDLRYEYLKQDQLLAGRQKTEPEGIPDTHDEIQTYNRNLFLELDYSFDQHWGGSLQLPWINRQHVHIDNDTPPETETWKFDTLGDARVFGRYQFSPDADNHAAWGMTAGRKLPTGEFDETNAEGVPAERSLQPGSGMGFTTTRSCSLATGQRESFSRRTSSIPPTPATASGPEISMAWTRE